MPHRLEPKELPLTTAMPTLPIAATEADPTWSVSGHGDIDKLAENKRDGDLSRQTCLGMSMYVGHGNVQKGKCLDYVDMVWHSTPLVMLEHTSQAC
jgi:hypothetical protein